MRYPSIGGSFKRAEERDDQNGAASRVSTDSNVVIKAVSGEQ